MFYTEEEFKQIEELKNEIVPIITNKASSSLSPSIIQLVETVGHRHWPSFCTKCSSGRYNLITRIYYRWLDEKTNEKNNKQTKNGNKEENRVKSTGNKSNRKSGSDKK